MISPGSPQTMRRTRWSNEGPFKRERAEISRNRGSQRLLAGTDVSFPSFPWWEEVFDTERICSALAEDLLCPCCSQWRLLLCGVIFWQVPRSPRGIWKEAGSRAGSSMAQEHPCATSPSRLSGKSRTEDTSARWDCGCHLPHGYKEGDIEIQGRGGENN